MPISVSRTHFALRYEVPKFLARGGHLCMAVLTISVLLLQLYDQTQIGVGLAFGAIADPTSS